MASLAVSVSVHLVLSGLLWFITPQGAAHSAVRAPVRITYFELPVLLTAPEALNLVLPSVSADLSGLPGRAITAPSVATEVQSGVGGINGIGDVRGSTGAEPYPAGGTEASQALPEPTQPPQPVPAQIIEEPLSSGSKQGRSSVVIAPPTKVVSLPKDTPPPSTPRPQPRTPTPDKVEPPAVASVVSTVQAGEIVDIGPGMPRPEIAKRAVPNYPPMARSQRVKGVVQVEVVVDTNGKVADAKVVASPSPLLNKEALDAANAMRFKPYVVGGQPVMFRTRIPFKFDFR